MQGGVKVGDCPKKRGSEAGQWSKVVQPALGNGQWTKWIKVGGAIAKKTKWIKVGGGRKEKKKQWTSGALENVDQKRVNGQKAVDNDICNLVVQLCNKSKCGPHREERGSKKGLREGISRWTADRALHWVQRGGRPRSA